MTAPPPRWRKQLSTPGLLKTIRTCFDAVEDHRTNNAVTSLGEALMAGFAVFSLKYPSLLEFDKGVHRGTLDHNLRTLYGVEHVPCDTQLRTILDPISPEALHPAFQTIHQQIQRQRGLEEFVFLDDHYLVLVDGTGHSSS